MKQWSCKINEQSSDGEDVSQEDSQHQAVIEYSRESTEGVNNPHWRVRPQVLSSNQTSPHVRDMLWSRGQPVATFVNKSDVNSMTEVMNVNSNARIVG